MKEIANRFVTILSLSTVTVALAACINQGTGAIEHKPSSSSNSPAAGSVPAAGPHFTMLTNVGFTEPQAGQDGNRTSPPTFTLYFNSSDRTQMLTNVCAPGGNDAKACFCSFQWVETNQVTSVPVERTVNTKPSQVTAFSVTCPGPDVYYTEIANGNEIKISVIPDIKTGNVSNFTTTQLTWKKLASTATGDFQDAEGRSFKNVVHYVCHDTFKKDLKIDHAQKSINVTLSDGMTTQTQTRPIANYFESSANGYSAQNYYYDFYVRSGQEGDANLKPKDYICPKAMLDGVEKYFPSDSSFAIALQRNSDFSVPVQANIVLSVTGQDVQGSVLGFAAQPNADGSCPTFAKDGTGTLLRTFRLRRYKVVYPNRYGPDGNILGQEQPVNRVLILDRPINKAGDPSKPLTRLGPKPCPFAFATQTTPSMQYACVTNADYFSGDGTLDSGWVGTTRGTSAQKMKWPTRTVDDTKIPMNVRCPIYPPLPEAKDDSGTYVGNDGTRPNYFDSGFNMHIRPFRAFLPYFVEDVTFKACAPQSQDPIDPKIIVRSDPALYTMAPAAAPDPLGPSSFYCAVYYPGQSDAIIESTQGAYDRHPRSCTQSDFRAALSDFSWQQFGYAAKNYACSRTHANADGLQETPTSGCCQSCVGACAPANPPPAGRDAAKAAGGLKTLSRGKPNSPGTCYDSYEE